MLVVVVVSKDGGGTCNGSGPAACCSLCGAGLLFPCPHHESGGLRTSTDPLFHQPLPPPFPTTSHTNGLGHQCKLQPCRTRNSTATQHNATTSHHATPTLQAAFDLVAELMSSCSVSMGVGMASLRSLHFEEGLGPLLRLQTFNVNAVQSGGPIEPLRVSGGVCCPFLMCLYLEVRRQGSLLARASAERKGIAASVGAPL